MAGEGKQHYKRSWKNLLINKDYQLKMTLVLVGVSGLLVAGLGWWVMDQAKTATEVAINNVEGTRCELPPWLEQESDTRVVVDEITEIETDQPDEEPTPEPTATGDGGVVEGSTEETADETPTANEEPTEPDTKSPAPTTGDAADEPTAPPEGTAATADGEGEAAAGADRTRAEVSITKSTMEITDDDEDVAAGAAAALDEIDADERAAMEQRYHDCELGKRARIIELRRGERLIFRVLVALGALLIVGLAGYGIKMTHKVAGPLFKVTSYLRKLRDGTYGEVYDLRKGDRLLEFYAHFKAAYAGVKKLQDEDIAHLRDVLAAAKASNLAEQSPELADSIAELEKVLAEKERSIG